MHSSSSSVKDYTWNYQISKAHFFIFELFDAHAPWSVFKFEAEPPRSLNSNTVVDYIQVIVLLSDQIATRALTNRFSIVVFVIQGRAQNSPTSRMFVISWTRFEHCGNLWIHRHCKKKNIAQNGSRLKFVLILAHHKFRKLFIAHFWRKSNCTKSNSTPPTVT